MQTRAAPADPTHGLSRIIQPGGKLSRRHENGVALLKCGMLLQLVILGRFAAILIHHPRRASIAGKALHDRPRSLAEHARQCPVGCPLVKPVKQFNDRVASTRRHVFASSSNRAMLTGRPGDESFSRISIVPSALRTNRRRTFLPGFSWAYPAAARRRRLSL